MTEHLHLIARQLTHLQRMREAYGVKKEGLTMEILHKIEVLKDTYPDEAELDRVLGKLLDVALSQHRMRLESAL